ncbi:MAG TPA: dodecin family protein [Gammaproteobacteria bacterium]
MANSVYKITEIVGTSPKSWEDAVSNAVETASKTLRNLRIAEVSALDVAVDNGAVREYRAKVKLSFKYEEDLSPAARGGEAAGEGEEERAPRAAKRPSAKKSAGKASKKKRR